MSGRKPSGLYIAEMPVEFIYIRNWFVSLKNHGDISFESMQAFFNLNQVQPTPFEVSLITDFDMAYREVIHGK